MKTTCRGRGRQRGYSLIIAVAIIALLTMVGVMVMDMVYADIVQAGSERASIAAMYVAEAGAVWGRDQVVNKILAGGTPNFSALGTTYPQLTQYDKDICPDATCANPPCATNCANWYALNPSSTAFDTYQNGQYRVAFTCNPNCTGTPVSYSIRGVGLVPYNTKRLVELTVGP